MKASRPERFDDAAVVLHLEAEVAEADHRRSEEAVEKDPAQAALIREWRSLLKTPPKVTVYRRCAGAADCTI